MMARDSSATRARILAAAIDEFTAYGLAGARIDRIAETAGANKRSIYVYFESKDRLFHAALDRVISDLIAAVPLTEDDLPGFAGRMFDYTMAHPQAVRLNLWRKLERPAAGPDESGTYARKIEAMTSGRSSATSGLPPTDLIVLIFGLAASWQTSPEDLLVADGSDITSAERIAVHRAAMVEAARRICAPAETTPTATREAIQGDL